MEKEIAKFIETLSKDQCAMLLRLLEGAYEDDLIDALEEVL